MAHHYLILQRLVKLQRDGHYDEKSCCGISACQGTVSYELENRRRQQRHNGKEHRAPKRYTHNGFG